MRAATLVLVLTLAALTAASSAQPLSQVDPQQALQGILTGNKVQDRLLIQAFQRGYQRGTEQSDHRWQAQVARLEAELEKAKNDARK